MPKILHTWHAKSILRFEANSESAMDFNGNSGKVEIAKGVTFTLQGSDGRTTQVDLFSGEGTLKIAEGAVLTFAKADFFAALKLAKVELGDGIVATVAEPVEGRVHIKYKESSAEDAAKITVKEEREWLVEAKEGEGYALSFLPMPAEGTNLEGEALATVRAAAKRVGLQPGFTVECSNGATLASVLACFSGLPMDKGNDTTLTVTCNFGIAALRVPSTEHVYLLAKVDRATFAEGVEFTVRNNGSKVGATRVTNPAEVGLPEANAGEQWLRVPFPTETAKYTITVSKE